MNLEDIVVHEIRQAQEDEFNIISFIKNYDLMEEGDRKMTTGVQYSKEIGIENMLAFHCAHLPLGSKPWSSHILL